MKPYLLRSKANRLADLRPADSSSDLNVIRISNSQEVCWKAQESLAMLIKYENSTSHNCCM